MHSCGLCGVGLQGSCTQTLGLQLQVEAVGATAGRAAHVDTSLAWEMTERDAWGSRRVRLGEVCPRLSAPTFQVHAACELRGTGAVVV